MSTLNYIRKKYTTTSQAYIQTWLEELFTDPLIGWTTYDSWTNNIVFKTEGDSGNNVPGYIHCDIYGSSDIRIYAYLYWDNINHTGTMQMPTSTTYCRFTFTNHNNEIAIIGNKDRVLLVNVGFHWEDYSAMLVGYIPDDCMIDCFKTTITADILHGYNVSVPVADSSGFRIDQMYQIVGINGEGSDWGLRVDSIPDSTHVVINDVPRDYTSGAKLGVFPHTFGVTGTYNNTSEIGIVTPRTNIGITTTEAVRDRTIIFGGYGNKSMLELANNINRSVLLPFFWIETLGPDNEQTILALENEFKTGQQFENSWGVMTILPSTWKEPLIGTTTSSGVNTLTDTSLSLTVDELIDLLICITDGTGKKQIRTIISNTSDTITVDGNWTVSLDNTSEYVIAERFYESCCDLLPLIWPIFNVNFLE